MKYSESEVSTLYQEDFTIPFAGTFGSKGKDIDVLTFVHHSISFDEVEKNKNIFAIIPGISINPIPYDIL